MLLCSEYTNHCEFLLLKCHAHVMYTLLSLSLSLSLLSQSKKRMRDVSHRPQLGQVEKRLLAIPLLYILLRMWGTLQFFFSLAMDHTNINGCIPAVVQKAYLAFGILQVQLESSVQLVRLAYLNHSLLPVILSGTPKMYNTRHPISDIPMMLDLDTHSQEGHCRHSVTVLKNQSGHFF